MNRMHTGYGEIIADVTGDLLQRALSEKDLGSLEKTAEAFKKIMV